MESWRKNQKSKKSVSTLRYERCDPKDYGTTQLNFNYLNLLKPYYTVLVKFKLKFNLLSDFDHSRPLLPKIRGQSHFYFLDFGSGKPATGLKIAGFPTLEPERAKRAAPIQTLTT